MTQGDTIAALATPAGISALAVVRMSGRDTYKILRRIADGSEVDALKVREARLLDLFAPEESDGDARVLLDRCIVLPFIAPHSYTGEDLVEIYCHGGRLVPQLILEALFASGARMAEPGEFTHRAFLNEKMDLAQAEAIEAIVRAGTRSELELAHQHYSGQFSREIRQIRSELIDLLSLLELELDFAEEDVEFANRTDLESRLQNLQILLQGLVNSYRRSHIVREGIHVAIVGRPNVGKSSLLNLLLKKERAIVTDHPGTTRDVIEESLEIRGMKFVFFDTAGIRDAENEVEKEGIRRSESVLQNASVVLLLVAQNEHLQKEDWEVRQRLLQYSKSEEKKKILIINKCDLPEMIRQSEIDLFGKSFERISLSCKSGDGLEQLEQRLSRFADELTTVREGSEATLLSLRQKEAAGRALQALERARASFQSNLSQEFVASDIRVCVDTLGVLIGEVSTEDILGNIFANFCIGK